MIPQDLAQVPLQLLRSHAVAIIPQDPSQPESTFRNLLVARLAEGVGIFLRQGWLGVLLCLAGLAYVSYCKVPGW